MVNLTSMTLCPWLIKIYMILILTIFNYISKSPSTIALLPGRLPRGHSGAPPSYPTLNPPPSHRSWPPLPPPLAVMAAPTRPKRRWAGEESLGRGSRGLVGVGGGPWAAQLFLAGA
jgi:hypothetical protein